MLRQELVDGGQQFAWYDDHNVVGIIERGLIFGSPFLVRQAVIIVDDLANTLGIPSGRINIRVIHGLLQSYAAETTPAALILLPWRLPTGRLPAAAGGDTFSDPDACE